MTKPTIERLWINKFNRLSDPPKPAIEIRVDWSNDRHHAVEISKPFEVDDVIESLKGLIFLIGSDPNLKGTENGLHQKEKRQETEAEG